LKRDLALQDAKEALREHPSPQNSPTQGSPTRKRAAKEARQEARRKAHERHGHLVDAMKSVEEQLQKTFLPKIFKGQQDLRKLAEASLQVWKTPPALPHLFPSSVE